VLIFSDFCGTIYYMLIIKRKNYEFM